MTAPRLLNARFVLTATLLVAVAACTKPIPDLREPVRINTTVPQSDITVDSQRILESHNSIRQQLGIPPLRWSKQMQVYATEWALFLADEVNCTPRFRGAVGLPLQKNGLGENIFKADSVVWSDGRREVADIDPQTVILDWAKQAVNYDYNSNSCALNETCDKYTQLVWKDSQVVGCGAATCPSKEQIWVCNYDPPGNFLSQRPY